jgi:hypothetical protein
MSSERSWLVRVGGADVPLKPGAYIIGRTNNCDVVLHSPNVSRRHARLVVSPLRVTIEDLGSQNGVFIEGQALAPGPHPVDPGATITIGGIELSVLAAEPRRSPREDRVTITTERQLAGWDEEPSGVSTSQADALEMVGPLVDKALREGRIDDADSMLHAHLMNVLQSLRKRHYVREENIRRSARYALQLAAGTGSGRWVDYAFEVLTVVRMPLDEDLVKVLGPAVAKVPKFDAERVRAYVDAMKTSERGARELWAIHQAEVVLKNLGPARAP